MTTISTGARGAPTAAARTAASDAGAAPEAEGDRSPTRLLVGAGVATGVVAAVAGAVYLRQVQPSRVIDVIDGVELLSNPRATGGIFFNRPTWGVPTNATVFGAGPGPRVSIEHVDQGALGDCWNIAGMGGIAHRRPEVIEGMVREVGEHIEVALPERTLRVTRELPLRADGAPRYGGTDPRLREDGQPRGPVDPVLWPAYVEKAQAALLRRGYRDLEGGWTKDSFRQLLGTNPARVTPNDSIDQYVIDNLRSRTPVAISTPSAESASPEAAQRMAELNIKHNHYYVPIKDTGDGQATTVQLFNPWGEKHPTRDLSRDDLRLIFDGLDTPHEYVRW